MTHEKILLFARQLLEGKISPEAFAESVACSPAKRSAPTPEKGAVPVPGKEAPRFFGKGVSSEGTAQPRGIDENEAACLDFDRQRRCGFPEVVFGEGKSVEVLIEIFQALLDNQTEVLATRVDSEKASQLVEKFPAAQYNGLGRTLRIDGEKTVAKKTGPKPTSVEKPNHEEQAKQGRVAIVTAGTSDLPVAEEARETLSWMGVETILIQDVGVAGPHRLPEQVAKLTSCDAVVVIAGMEGALPSIVGGYVACPVIGVPTSVGYGASFGGVAALLGMLNSCAANVAVVNIDAGFKGAYLAGMIARGTRRTKENKENSPAQENSPEPNGLG